MGRVIKDVLKLKIHALRGEKEYQLALKRMNDQVAKEVNKQLRELERRGYDYFAYDTATHFTQTVYESNRFKLSKDMEEDYDLMATQTQIGLKFQGMKSSTVKGQQEIEEKRYNTFIDLEIVEEGYSRRKFRNFLKFLGKEESQGVMESYGTSDQMVQILFDAFNRRRLSKEKMLARFRDYLDREKDYDLRHLIKDLGLNWDDYRSTKWRKY